MKYIFNGHTALVKVKDENGKFVYCYPRTTDRATGVLVRSGYAEISDETAKYFEKENGVVKYFIKAGKMQIMDKKPETVQTPEELVLARDTEIIELKAKITELEADSIDLEKYIAKEEYDKAVSVLRAELDKALEKISVLEKGTDDKGTKGKTGAKYSPKTAGKKV